jgi:hypothetical protein
VKWWLPLVLFFAVVFSGFAQQPQLPVSKKYPLQAQIVSVETEQQQNLTNGNGETSITHLVKAEIDGKTYRLSIKLSLRQKRPFQHHTWLQPGFYPAHKTEHGFEFEYQDGDKIRHEELHIVSVE